MYFKGLQTGLIGGLITVIFEFIQKIYEYYTQEKDNNFDFSELAKHLILKFVECFIISFIFDILCTFMPWLRIIILICCICGLIYWIYKNKEKILKCLKMAWENTKNGFINAWEITKNGFLIALENTKKSTNIAWENTQKGTQIAWENTKTGTNIAWENTQKGLNVAWENTINETKKAWNETNTFFKNIFKKQ